MEHSILCSNQARFNNVIIDDVPRTVDYRWTSTQSIIIPEGKVLLSLYIHGAVVYASVRFPTDYDMDNFAHINVTDGNTIWNPMIIDQSCTINSYSNERDPIISSMMLDDYVNL